MIRWLSFILNVAMARGAESDSGSETGAESKGCRGKDSTLPGACTSH